MAQGADHIGHATEPELEQPATLLYPPKNPWQEKAPTPMKSVTPAVSTFRGTPIAIRGVEACTSMKRVDQDTLKIALAVVEIAWDDLTTGKDLLGAADYFLMDYSQDTSWPFSFRSFCGHYDADVEVVRRRISKVIHDTWGDAGSEIIHQLEDYRESIERKRRRT